MYLPKSSLLLQRSSTQRSGVKALKGSNQTVGHGATVELSWSGADVWDDDSWHNAGGGSPVDKKLIVPSWVAANTRVLVFYYTIWTAAFLGKTTMNIKRFDSGDVLVDQFTDDFDNDESVSSSRPIIRAFPLLAVGTDYFTLTAYQQSGVDRDVDASSSFGAQIL